MIALTPELREWKQVPADTMRRRNLRRVNLRHRHRARAPRNAQIEASEGNGGPQSASTGGKNQAPFPTGVGIFDRQVPFAFVQGEQECSICRRLVNQWE